MNRRFFRFLVCCCALTIASGCGKSTDGDEDAGLRPDAGMDASSERPDTGDDVSPEPDASMADLDTDIVSACRPNPCAESLRTACAVAANGEILCLCDPNHVEDPETGQCVPTSCEGDPCTEPNRGVCTEEQGRATCACDIGFIEDPDTLDCVLCVPGEVRTLGSCGPFGLGVQQEVCDHSGGQWVDDGCEDPTVLEKVTDLRATGLGGADFAGVRVFQGERSTTGRELFATDGTAAGTALLREFGPGTDDAWTLPFPVPLATTAAGVVVNITAAASAGVWVTDGSPLGTTRIPTLAPTMFAAGSGLALWETRESIPAAPNAYERVVWASDGTLANTFRIHDYSDAWHLDSVIPLPQLQGTMFHVSLGNGLLGFYCTDGTPAGTELLGAFNWYGGGIEFGGKLFFNEAAANDTDRELWVTDCTAAGTMEFANLWAGGSSSPSGFGPVAGGFVFFADDGTPGTELWFSDGTTGGTRFLDDITLGSDSASVSGNFSLGDVALFTVEVDQFNNVHDLYATDGTIGGNKRILTDITEFRPLIRTGEAFFRHEDKVWRTDGTVAGTFAITTIPGDNFVWPEGFIGGRLLITEQVDPLTNAWRLWLTDGTVGGEVEVAIFGTKSAVKIQKDLNSSDLGDFVLINADDPATGEPALWILRPQ